MPHINTSPSPREVLDRVQAVPQRMPYSMQTLEFMKALSNTLLRDADVVRRFPDAAAFGAWIRPTRLRDAAERFAAIESLEGGNRLARGLSLHIAPGNVEALFAYSWAAATLAGCRSIVRVSSRRSGLTETLVSAIHKASTDVGLAQDWEFVYWDNSDDNRLDQFASAANILVFWGGNETITRLSRAPRRPHARVLTFPDRESLAIVNGLAYLALDDAQRHAVAGKISKDLLSFGQAACSSTRFVCWIGSSDNGLDDLLARIDAVSITIPTWEPAEVMRRRTYAFELAAREPDPISSDEHGGLLVLKTEGAVTRQLDHPGLGTIVAVHLHALAGLEMMLRETDQTLTYFGFDQHTLRSWLMTTQVHPRRIIPIGRAVDFDDRWDGMDLPLEFTELVTID